MSENLPARVKFFRDSIQQIIDSRAEPSYDMLRSLLVEDERLAEWERRTGTAPQEAQADPKSGTWDEKDEAYLQAVAPVPQTEGEDKAAQLKRNLLAMGYTDDQAQEIATRLALMGGYA